MTTGPGESGTSGTVWRPPSEPALRSPAAEPPPSPPPAPPAPQGDRRWRPALIVGIAGLVVGAITGGLAGGLIAARLDDDPVAGDVSRGEAGGSLDLDLTTAITAAARKASPAVVRVESATRRSLDVGSGVVVSAEGYIVTNAHVVMGTDQLKVVFADGSERPAVLIGHDYPFNDIAVLQVAPVGLSVIEVGDSAELEPGETVLAIGNPLGELYGSVTVGVVSGLNRSRVLDGMRHDDIIQTDAAINSGNSGGALVNLAGQLVGMPTTILRQSNGGQPVEGVAFAIPSRRVMEIANLIIAARGPIARPSLQLEHLDLNDEVAARLPALPTSTGAVVLAVAQGGAAAQAGVRAGDVIVRVGDTAVDAQTPLLNALAKHQPGETVKVVLNRNGRIIETEVRLARRS
ncbi:S1C family serine protease [Tepidiforma thermophila]|uniref:2-alkenal reductase n=1 Tax=Tepidiforma thermophila (strain KCTC 52669 / CGMCC 1.13589 / G233) TaxID=2761530 RepID=A0A2A9HH34_TEPT2|nr:trypsin-like peptidase domain-containing protein [Tepidiforma thermophila]PFG74673.1 2-alkenal reductase [Tepidiforma thermophila]